MVVPDFLRDLPKEVFRQLKVYFLFSRGQGFGREADERDEGSDRGQVQRPVDLIHAGLVVFVAVVVFLQKHAKRASLLNINLILLFWKKNSRPGEGNFQQLWQKKSVSIKKLVKKISLSTFFEKKNQTLKILKPKFFFAKIFVFSNF